MTKKILIADDSPTFRHLEQELLRRRGYELVHAEDGAKAVRLAAEHLPDLILLDLQMPVMDGHKALGILKSNERTRHIPIIVITTEAWDHRQEAVAKLGADGFLSKPIRAAELTAAVRDKIGDAEG